MESFLIYIGKAAIGAGAFYLAFLALFQNQKHFGFNRIYLPVSMLLSFVIPLITFTSVKYVEANNFNTNSFAYLAGTTAPTQENNLVFEWYHYLFGLYMAGSLIFLFHLLLGHLKAIQIIRKSWIQQLFGNRVNVTKKEVHPFSFFHKIVLSEKTLNSEDLQMIVFHENIHVKEKHTLDILLVEILFLFQWFNPFAWLLKDAVKNNLEYKTDHQIAQRFNPQKYQLAMVALADKKGVAPFLTALNGSQLKNRIIMMKKKTENRYSLVKQLVVLPLLAILVMGLSNKKVEPKIVDAENSKITSQFSSSSFDEDFKSKLFKDGLFVLQDYGEGAPLIFLNGKKVVDKIVLNEGEIKWTEIIEGQEATERFGNEGKNGAMFFYTEKEFEWPNPVKNLIVNVDGEVVSPDNPDLKKYDTTKGFDSGKIIDALKIDGNKVQATTLDFNKEGATLYILTSDYVPGTKPEFDEVISVKKKESEEKETFYAVDNEIVSKAFFEKYGKEGFESVVVLTGKDASNKYGNNYENIVDAKTGKANFKIKKDTLSRKPPQVNKILRYGDDDLSEALYIVDGMEVKDISDLDPENINSISVLKDQSA
ncbi:MAG: hypothetical protein JW761_01995, partial [Prolixibacteraceae bacterium]|nr:hypothetical protein [Prolixibacteraceae bacterium]